MPVVTVVVGVAVAVDAAVLTSAGHFCFSCFFGNCLTCLGCGQFAEDSLE